MSDTFPAVMPHGAFEQVFEDVFYLQGAVQFAPLVRITRAMTVLRHEGELTLINAIRLSDAGVAELDKLGKVAHVFKIGNHGMDSAWYVDRYGAKVWTPPGLAHAGGPKTDFELTPDAELPIPGASVFRFELTKNPEVAILVPVDGGLLVTCDSVQNWEDTKGCSFVGSLVTKKMGFIGPARIGPPWRKAMTPDGGSLRPDFERLVALPFRHLIPGHGRPLKDVAQQRLQETIQSTYASA